MADVVRLMDVRKCQTCPAVIAIADFPKYNNGKTRGVMKICRECKKKRDREYKRNTRLNNPEFAQIELDRNKAYRDRHPEGYRTHMRNKREKTKSLYHTNLLYRLSRIVQSAESRAKKKGLEYSISAEFLFELAHKQQMRCAVTGVEFSLIPHDKYHKNPFGPSIDRKNCDDGYTKENVQLVCTWYNMFKNEWDDQDIRSLIFTAYHTMFGG